MNYSENQNKVAAVIPFFNEEKHLINLINVTKEFVDLLVLVNDGSTDSSPMLIPSSENIILLNHPKNLGKGASLKSGFLECIKLGVKVTITLDADYQHDPRLIPQFLSEIENYDAVIGVRERDSSMPFHRKMSNYLTSKLLSIKTGKVILDSQSGYRAYRTKVLKDILPNYFGFEAESEMIVKICRNNLKLGFVKIPTLYGNDESKIKAIPTILGFIKVLFKS